MPLPYTTYLKLTKILTSYLSAASPSYVPSKTLVRLGLEHFPGTEKAVIVEAIKRMVDERILKPVKVSSPRQVVFGLMRGFDRGKAGWMEKGQEEGVGDDRNGGESAEPGDGPIDYIGNGWPLNPVEGTPGTIVVQNGNMRQAEKGDKVVHADNVGEEESQETPDTRVHEESDEEYVESQETTDTRIHEESDEEYVESQETPDTRVHDECDEEILESQYPDGDPGPPMRRHSRAYEEMTRNAVPLPPSPRRRSIDIGTPSRKRVREIAASDACSSNEPTSPHKPRNSTPRRSAKRLCTPLSESRRRSAPSNLQRSPLKPLDPNKMLALENLPNMPAKKEKNNTAPAWVLVGLEGLRSKYPDDLFEVDHDHIHCMDCEKGLKICSSQGNVNNFDTHLRSKGHRAMVDARLRKPRHSGTLVPATAKTIDFQMPSEPLKVFNQKGASSIDQAMMQLSAVLKGDSDSNQVSLEICKQRLSHLEMNHSSHAKQLAQVIEISKSAEEKYQCVSDAYTAAKESHREQFAYLEKQLSNINQTRENADRKAEERFETFEEKQSNRVNRLDSKLKGVEENSQDQLKELRIRNSRGEKRHKEDFENIRDILRKSNEENKKLKELVEQHNEQLAQMSEQLQKAEALANTQESTITDLESQSQVHTEELQRFRENEETTRRNFTAQMTVHFEQTDSRIKAIERASEERLAQFERDLLGKVWKSGNMKAKQIEALEKQNVQMKMTLQRFEWVIPQLFKDLLEVQQKVLLDEEELEEEDVETEETTEGCGERIREEGEGENEAHIEGCNERSAEEANLKMEAT